MKLAFEFPARRLWLVLVLAFSSDLVRYSAVADGQNEGAVEARQTTEPGPTLKEQAASLEEEEARLRSAAEARREENAEALRTLTSAVQSVRTNALADLAFLLDALKGRANEAEVVEGQYLRQVLGSMSVGPYIVLKRQHGVIHALQVGGYAAGPLVPVLIESMKSDDIVLASAATAAIGALGRNASSAVPALLEAAGSERLPVSRNAVAALGDVSGSSPELVELLMEILAETRDEITKENAVISLGKQGETAAAASAALRNLLSSPDVVGNHAAVSLAKIAPEDPQTLQAFKEMLEQPASVSRLRAITALGYLPSDEEVIKLLEGATRDPWPRYSELARSVLRMHQQR